jgi:hypothetical protein
MEMALVVSARVRWSGSLVERSLANDGSQLEADDSAIHALTDFQHEYPITVDAGTGIDEALADMNRLCVHALLVTRATFEGVDPQVAGLITAYDIARERSHSSSRMRVHKHATVGEIMTPGVSGGSWFAVASDSRETPTALSPDRRSCRLTSHLCGPRNLASWQLSPCFNYAVTKTSQFVPIIAHRTLKPRQPKAGEYKAGEYFSWSDHQ